MDGVPFVNSTAKLNTVNAISIFPNPTYNKKIKIHSSSIVFGTCYVEILNVTGQTVYQFNNIHAEKNIELELPEKTANDTYIVVVTSGSKRYNSKLILH